MRAAHSGTSQELVRRSAFTTYLERLQSSGVHVVLDDLRPSTFNLEGKESWSVNRDSRWLAGTETRWEGERSGAFEALLSGQEVRVVGRAPTAPGIVFRYTIDGGEKVDVAFPSPSSQASNTSSPDEFRYYEWAKIPLPNDRNSHQLLVSAFPSGTSVDYVVLRVHDSYPLEKELAIMDDSDSNLEWKGTWAEMSTNDISVGVQAFGGGVHAAREVGSEVEIKFIGSSVSIYTLVPPSSLSASFTLDGGQPERRTYGSSSASPSPNSEQSVVPNYPLYTLTGLSSSLHTLTVKLTDNPSNSSLVLDYITYTPSFTSIDALASSNGDPAKYASRQTSDEAKDGVKKTMSPGTLAGTIVGVVVVVLVLISCFCCRGKRYFVRRAWRNWRHGSKGSAGDIGNRSASPEWYFTDPKASRTSLEMDLDLDLSPRAREKRHQQRDKARARNKARTSESKTDGHRASEDAGLGKSKSKAKALAESGGGGSSGSSSGLSKKRSRRDGVGSPSTASSSNLGSGSRSHGASTAASSSRAEGAIVPDSYLDIELPPMAIELLSEKAQGKLPARDSAGISSSAHPQPSSSCTPRSAPSLSSSQLRGMADRAEHEDGERQEESADVSQEIVNAYFASGHDREEESNADRKEVGMGQVVEGRRNTPKVKGDTDDDEDLSETEGRGGRLEETQTTPSTAPVDTITPFTETQPPFTSVAYSSAQEEKQKEAMRSRSERDRPTDHTGDSQVTLPHEFKVTPFTSMEPTPSASQRKMKEAFGVGEGGIIPFTAMQPGEGAPSSRKEKEAMGNQRLPEGSVTPFRAMRPSEGAGLSKKEEAMGSRHLPEGGIAPFTMMQPTQGSALLKNGKEAGYVSPPPLPSTSSGPGTVHHGSDGEPAHLALQAQLAALMEEVNLQQSRGEVPSPERLNEMLRLGRAIEEAVEKLEERGLSSGDLPPAYDALEDERVGIAL
ncbi:hypothetical protein NMY22_g10462 [Coprinellus aureogranulatus]|nr:hypothetical protein NMY22_g10462 [Coprinellus aureogranulatus]